MWDSPGYWLTTLVFKRGLALTYLIAFIVALNQFRPLLGEHGLLPVPAYVKTVTFRESPSLFLFWPKDWVFAAAAWMGIVLACVALLGLADRYPTWVSMIVWAVMWALYLSFVNVGQIFYGFGWESILLEAGFLTIFLGARGEAPQTIAIWLLRWLLFRVMFGAGLIKLRGDSCWRDLTCLDYHYQTQPMPNPLSWFFYWGPEWTHKAGVLFNHFAELIVPFFYFAPQPIASIAGVITIIFQATIMASGNLSWLNFLTIVLAVPTIDSRWLSFVLPLRAPDMRPSQLGYRIAVGALAVLVAFLSINPIRNMMSKRQIMNTAFNPYHLVGTYGAFGSITRTRYEIVVEGTDEVVLTPSTKWREYEFRGKPGPPGRLPPQIAPYHLRLDWLMWFAAMSEYYEHPWFVHFVAKLLEGDRDTLSLLQSNPFPDRPPRYIRAELYEYRFTTPDERKTTGMWWDRKLAGEYFPPISLSDATFQGVLERMGWK